MKKIFFLLLFLGVGYLVKAQTNPFPSTDSLERFINRYIRNSPVEAFQNLRQNTALIGLLRFIQQGGIAGGLDTAYAVNDSTLRLITFEPDTFDVVLPGATGGDLTTTIVRKPIIVYEGSGSNPDTLDLVFGYGIVRNAGDSAIRVDTLNILTRAMGQKKIDSVAALATSATITDSAVSKAYAYRPAPNSTNYNNEWIVEAAGVFRFDVSGGIGSHTTGVWIESGGHKKQYFDSIVVDASSNVFRVYWPKVKEIFEVQGVADETFAGLPIRWEPSVALDQAVFTVYREVEWGGDLVGTGSGTGFTAGGGLSGVSFDWASSPGLLRISQPSSITGKDVGKWTAVYSGDSSGRTLKRKISGLSSFEAGWFLCDDVGNPITINPGAGDRITISSNIHYNAGYGIDPVNADNTIVLSNLSNIWLEAKFEVYMKVTQVNTTSNFVKWQAYPSATAYKIYRDVNADFSTQTLIYSGTGFQYQDVGLTTNTQYHYKMVAVVSGVDTEVTKGWKCRTL